MSAELAHVPEEARSILRNNKHVLLRRGASDAVAALLLPPDVAPPEEPFVSSVFVDHCPLEEEDDDDSDGSCSADSLVSADSFRTAHEMDVWDAPALLPEWDAPASAPPHPSSAAPTTVLLRGVAGMGKSTLAALVASRQDVRTACDRIGWIGVGRRLQHAPGGGADARRNSLDYEMYRDCLRALLRQLLPGGARPFAGEVACLARDPMAVGAAQVRAMLAARDEMARLLARGGVRHLLLVLDDVWCHEDVGLFDFSSGRGGAARSSLLVTTRTADTAPFPRTRTVRLGAPDEADGLRLLGWELGLAEGFEFGRLDGADRALLLEILRRCGRLPLALRMLGRSARLFFGRSEGYSLDQVLRHAMTAWGDSDSREENASMYVTFDRTFSLAVPAEPSARFLKLCFGALAVAFARTEILRPWVSLDVVIMLWKSLLDAQTKEVTEALRRDGLFRCDDVCRIMETVGAIDVLHDEREYVRVSHDMLWEFGREYLENNPPVALQGGGTHHQQEDASSLPSWTRWFRRWTSPPTATPTGPAPPPPATVSQFLHRRLVALYEEQTHGRYCCADDGHLYSYYPLHMIDGGLLAPALALLRDRNFIAARLRALGIEGGARRHMRDVELLWCRAAPPSAHAPALGTRALMELVNAVVAAVVSSDYADTRGRPDTTEMLAIKMGACLKARGLNIVGATTQKLYLWNVSMDCFSKALQYLKFLELPSSHPEVRRTLKYIDDAMLYPLQLVHRGSPQRIVLKHAARLRAGDAPAGVPLVLSSHPGRAIVPLKNHFDYLPFFGRFTVLGIGSEESALEARYDGEVLARVGDGALLNVMAGWHKEGVQLTLKPAPADAQERARQLPRMNGSRRFAVNEDGTMSPRHDPDLVLGLSYCPQLYFVDRGSPNRAVFTHADALRAGGDDDAGTPLELSSHPTHSIAMVSAPVLHDCGVGHVNLGLGTAKEALRVRYRHNKLIVCGDHDFRLTGHYPGSYGGNCAALVGSALPRRCQTFLLRAGLRLLWHCWTDFVVNEDGTISPVAVPDLALGFQVPSFAGGTPRGPVSGHTHDRVQNRAARHSVGRLLFTLAVKLVFRR